MYSNASIYSKQKTSKKTFPNTRHTDHLTITNYTGLGLPQQSHKNPKKRKWDFPVRRPGAGRWLGPSRGKMGARLGGRTHSIVVEDVCSTHQTRLVRDEGAPHAQFERANQSEKNRSSKGAHAQFRTERPLREHAQ